MQQPMTNSETQGCHLAVMTTLYFFFKKKEKKTHSIPNVNIYTPLSIVIIDHYARSFDSSITSFPLLLFFSSKF